MAGLFDYFGSYFNQPQTIRNPVGPSYPSTQKAVTNKAVSSSGPPPAYQQNPSAYPLTTAAIQAAQPGGVQGTATSGNGGGGNGGAIPTGYARNADGSLYNLDVNAGRAPQADPYAGIRNDISSAWDNYINGLQGTAGYLNDQRTAQEGIANSQFEQGQAAINTQKASSLRDIANTTRNAFQAGNNYLGSMGAGDSSAANQYAFAINQQANQQTGDLNNFVSSQMQNLQSTHDQQIQSIAQWFAQQQETLRQQMAQGGLQKGQDLANLSRGILDQAIQATNAIKANSQNQYNALVSWAASNSQNIGQLQQNIAGIPQAMGQMQMGSPMGSNGIPVGGGALSYADPNKKPLFQ